MQSEEPVNTTCHHPVLISVSSNCGDRIKNCKDALSWLASFLKDAVSSSVYETDDISCKNNSGSSASHTEKPKYMNAVLSGYSELSLEQLNENLKEYELSHGRDSVARSKGEVPIDLDIVKWNDDIIRPRDFAAEYFRKGLDEIE